VFAIACMALNILVGYTGLTSFGHGAWFGLAPMPPADAAIVVSGFVPATGAGSAWSRLCCLPLCSVSSSCGGARVLLAPDARALRDALLGGIPLDRSHGW